MKTYTLCTILWRAPVYTYELHAPKEDPSLQRIAGWIMDDTPEFVVTAMNVSYEKHTGEMYIVDGVAIPKSAIIEMKPMGSWSPTAHA